jgi:L-fuconolactonase
MMGEHAIDAHQHFWRLDRGDYGWLTPRLGPIYRDFLPVDLVPLLMRHGIEGTILVQAAPTIAETEFLLSIAEASPFVLGVVGWADFDTLDATDVIARLAEQPLLVGMRPMIQDLDDDDWLLRSTLAPAFRGLIEHRLVFDALVMPRHLTRLARVLERHDPFPVVIDHAAKPALRGDARAFDSWRQNLEVLASFPHVRCKLSGLLTEAPPNATVETLRPCVDHVIETFGPDRVIWGSDWPVVNLAGGYDHWHALTGQLLEDLPERTKDAILGDNARRLYLSSRGQRWANWSS